MTELIDRDAALAELQAIEVELRRRRWLNDPVLWAKERLGIQLWSGQETICLTFRDSRRLAVRSCHEIGKSFISALLICWWIDCHKPGEAFVVTTAPTGPQVKAVLWREIGRLHALGNLPGRVNQTEWFREVNGKEELVAFGRKPSEYNPTAFQGIHAPYVLVVVDEACGVRGQLWDAADSLIANDWSKCLAIFNPDDASAEVHDYCKPGSGWKVIGVSAFDTPNFTGEVMPTKVLQQLIGRIYVEEKRKKWASTWRWVNVQGQPVDWTVGRRCVPPPGGDEYNTNPFWQSKVLGRFPRIQGDKSLIPMVWITAAQERTLEPGEPVELGQDVGGGGDESTRCLRRGSVFRIIAADQNPDTMQTCGALLADLRATGARVAKVDEIGIGRGVVDRAQEQNRPVVGINVGEKSTDPEAYFNLRSELCWAVRERFETGDIDIDPQDEDLAAELANIRFERTSRGQVKVESKKEMAKRGLSSPNRFDALMLANAPVYGLVPAGALDIGADSSTGISMESTL